MNWENETGTLQLGDFAVEKGDVIREARLAWQRFGRAQRQARQPHSLPQQLFQVASRPTVSWLIGRGHSRSHALVHYRGWHVLERESSGAARRGLSRALHRRRQCRGRNTVSSPRCTAWTNLAAVYGFSMGGMQAYHWAALYPEMVETCLSSSAAAPARPITSRSFCPACCARSKPTPSITGQWPLFERATAGRQGLWPQSMPAGGLRPGFLPCRPSTKRVLARPSTRNLRPHRLGRAVFASRAQTFMRRHLLGFTAISAVTLVTTAISRKRSSP